jgi:hypothetical protein
VFLKITEVAHIFLAIFPQLPKIVQLFWQKKTGCATFWAIFFANSLGHPCEKPPMYVWRQFYVFMSTTELRLFVVWLLTSGKICFHLSFNTLTADCQIVDQGSMYVHVCT